MFEKDEKRYNCKLIEGKKKLISKLLMAIDKDVKDGLVTGANSLFKSPLCVP